MANETEQTNTTFSNWVKAVMGLRYLKAGFENIVDNQMKKRHAELVDITKRQCHLTEFTCDSCSATTLLPYHKNNKRPCPQYPKMNCFCLNTDGRRECTQLGACGLLYDNVIDDHSYSDPKWQNIEFTKWLRNHWQLAKGYINAIGYIHIETATNTDVLGLLNICKNNKYVSLNLALEEQSAEMMSSLEEVLDTRHKIFHSGSLAISRDDLDKFIDKMVAFLSLLTNKDAKVTETLGKLKDLPYEPMCDTCEYVVHASTDALDADVKEKDRIIALMKQCQDKTKLAEYQNQYAQIEKKDSELKQRIKQCHQKQDNLRRACNDIDVKCETKIHEYITRVDQRDTRVGAKLHKALGLDLRRNTDDTDKAQYSQKSVSHNNAKGNQDGDNQSIVNTEEQTYEQDVNDYSHNYKVIQQPKRVPFCHFRINVFGDKGAGKSTVVQNLVVGNRVSVSTNDLQDDFFAIEESTWETERKGNVISTRNNTAHNADHAASIGQPNKAVISFWEFSSKAAYYSTYEAFCGPGILCLIVVDLEKMSQHTNKHNNIPDLESLLLWTSVARTYSPEGEGIVIIGTHCDQIGDTAADLQLLRIRKALQMRSIRCVKVENKSSLNTIQMLILRQGLRAASKQYSASYTALETSLDALRSTCKVITKDTIDDLSKKMDIPMTTIEEFLSSLHCRGQVYRLNNKCILLDKFQIVDFMNAFLDSVSRQHNESNTGLFDECSIDNAMSDASVITNIDWKYIANLRQMLFNIKVIVKLPYVSQTSVIHAVPCLLARYQAEQKQERLTSLEPLPRLKICFQKSYLPHGLFYTYVKVMLLRMSPYKQLSVIDGKPQLFREYASLDIGQPVVQCQMHLTNTMILVKLTKSASLTPVSICRIVDDIEGALQDTLETFPNIFKFDICVECQIHEHHFLPLNYLRKWGVCDCVMRHSVGLKDVFGTNDISVTQRQVPDTDIPVTEKHIGRLALKMNIAPMDLAKRLRLQDGLNEIGVAKALFKGKTKESRMRLFILDHWNLEDRQKTLEDLICSLTVTGFLKDLTKSDLKKMALDATDNNLPGFNGDILKTIVQEIQFGEVARCIGDNYPFLMLELGLSIGDIYQTEYLCHGTTSETVQELLRKWTVENPFEATIECLLKNIMFCRTPACAFEKRYSVH